MNSDNDNDGTVFVRQGIPPKNTYKRTFPLPRKQFDRDHLNHVKSEYSQNGNPSGRYMENNLRTNMKRYRNRNNNNNNNRRRFNNYQQQNHRSVQDRIQAIRNNTTQNSNRFVDGVIGKDQDAKTNYNNSLDGSSDSIDMNLQFNVTNFKNEKRVDDDMNIVAVDDDDDDDDEQIEDPADITVQVRNDKVQKSSGDQVERFKMILDAKAQLAIKKIQSRNKQKQVIYPYPVTPHTTGLTTHERFSVL